MSLLRGFVPKSLCPDVGSHADGGGSKMVLLVVSSLNGFWVFSNFSQVVWSSAQGVGPDILASFSVDDLEGVFCQFADPSRLSWVEVSCLGEVCEILVV